MANPTTPDTPNAGNSDCFSCEIVATYVDLVKGFTAELSQVMVGPMQILFVSITGLWVVIQGYRLILGFARLDDAGKEFAFVVIAWVLLFTAGPGLVNNVFTASLKMMGSAAAVALNTASKGGAMTVTPESGALGAGMVDLVRATEKGLLHILSMAEAILGSFAWSNWSPVLYAVALVIPWILLLIVYGAQVTVSIFRVAMLAALSPFMMLGFGFNWGRGMAFSGMRTILSSFMVLFGSTLAVGFVLYAVGQLDIKTSGKAVDLASLSNAKFLVPLVLGWMGTAFITEATGIANSITGSALNNMAAATMVTGAGTTGYLAMKAGRQGLGFLGQLRLPNINPVTGENNIGQRAADLVKKALKQ